MMSWIGQVIFTLTHEDGEVIILGERSDQELSAHYESTASVVRLSGPPVKVKQFMGVPVVPTRGINKLLVEIHVRDPYTGMAKILRLR